jgi:hypothetical protein
MRLERVAEFVGLGSLGEFRQSFHKLLFGVVDVGQFVQKQFVKLIVHASGFRIACLDVAARGGSGGPFHGCAFCHIVLSFFFLG